MIHARTPRLVFTFLACLLAAGTGSADENGRSPHDTLATPPLTLGTSLACIAANVGRKQATLDIELHDVNGTAVAAQRCTLPPGAVNAGGSQCSIVEAAPAGFVGYCTFTVLRGNTNDIRAAILSSNANLGPGAQPTALAAH